MMTIGRALTRRWGCVAQGAVWSARLDQQANRIVTASADYNVYAPPRSFFLSNDAPCVCAVRSKLMSHALQ